MTNSSAQPVNTFAGLWDEIKTSALNVVSRLKSSFVVFEKQAVPVIESDLVAFFQQLVGAGTQMAVTLATQEFSNLTGGQKNAITLASIKAAAMSLGKPLVEQDAQMLAQQSYHGAIQAIQSLGIPASSK